MREQLLQWFAQNQFRILDPAADGSAKTYDAPELTRDRGRVQGGQLRFTAPPGSVVGLNVAAAGSSTPTVFQVLLAENPGGVHIHGEFFGPTSIGHLGGGAEFEMINSIWAPAGAQRKKAYALLTSFEAFVAGLNASPR